MDPQNWIKKTPFKSNVRLMFLDNLLLSEMYVINAQFSYFLFRVLKSKLECNSVVFQVCSSTGLTVHSNPKFASSHTHKNFIIYGFKMYMSGATKKYKYKLQVK